MDTAMLAFAFLVCLTVTSHGVTAPRKELPGRERLWVLLCGAAGTGGVVRAVARLYDWL